MHQQYFWADVELHCVIIDYWLNFKNHKSSHCEVSQALVNLFGKGDVGQTPKKTPHKEKRPFCEEKYSHKVEMAPNMVKGTLAHMDFFSGRAPIHAPPPLPEVTRSNSLKVELRQIPTTVH